MPEDATPLAPAPEPLRHYLPPGHILTVIAGAEGPCTVQRLAPPRSDVVYDVESAAGPQLQIGPFPEDRQYAIQGAASHSIALHLPDQN